MVAPVFQRGEDRRRVGGGAKGPGQNGCRRVPRVQQQREQAFHHPRGAGLGRMNPGSDYHHWPAGNLQSQAPPVIIISGVPLRVLRFLDASI